MQGERWPIGPGPTGGPLVVSRGAWVARGIGGFSGFALSCCGEGPTGILRVGLSEPCLPWPTPPRRIAESRLGLWTPLPRTMIRTLIEKIKPLFYESPGKIYSRAKVRQWGTIRQKERMGLLD